MKLLVTGGAGYIGSIVAAQLLDAGHDVTVLDSLVRGHAAAVPEGARLEQVDLLDAEAVSRHAGRRLRRRPALRRAGARRRVGRAPRALPPRQLRRDAEPARRDARGRLQAAGVLLHLRGLRRARRDPDARDAADRPGQRLRRLQARGRPDDQRRVPRARARRGLAALLQRRGRERRSRRGPRARDPHHPARAAGRGRQARPRLGVRHRLRHARRHRRARLHPHRGPRRGAHPRPRARHRARSSTASTTSATAPASRSAR